MAIIHAGTWQLCLNGKQTDALYQRHARLNHAPVQWPVVPAEGPAFCESPAASNLIGISRPQKDDRWWWGGAMGGSYSRFSLGGILLTKIVLDDLTLFILICDVLFELFLVHWP